MKLAALEAAVNALELTFADIAAVRIAEETWRRTLIASRRRLEQQGRHVAQLIGELDDDGRRSDDLRDLRSEFSRMRSVIAHHWATWPVIKIAPDDRGYIQSAKVAYSANNAFFHIARTTIQTLRARGTLS